MKLTLRFICLLVFLLSLFSANQGLWAQEEMQFKIEREYKIAARKVHPKAIQGLNFIFSNKARKTKWYRQEEYNSWSYEAKLEYKDEDYSVEFDSLGNLINIEVTISWGDIAELRRAAMKTALTERFGKYKIEKIQETWVGDLAYVKKRVLSFDDYDEDDDDEEDIRYKDYEHTYEMIIIAKENSTYESFEAILSSNGAIISVSKIIEDNIDHLTY